jgi:hypothetical protein
MFERKILIQYKKKKTFQFKLSNHVLMGAGEVKGPMTIEVTELTLISGG